MTLICDRRSSASSATSMFALAMPSISRRRSRVNARASRAPSVPWRKRAKDALSVRSSWSSSALRSRRRGKSFGIDMARRKPGEGAPR